MSRDVTMIRQLLGCSLLTAALGVGDAQAAVRRFALMVGNNEGSGNMVSLVFAEEDALKIQDVLISVGGYRSEDVRVLLGRDRNDLLKALAGFRGEVDQARSVGDETLFLFYYSGHADEDRLQLGRSWITYEELDLLIERTGADVRLAFLDACQSGAMTRSKGGTLAPSFVFDLTERLGAAGQVVITSSSGDEASQESDEIGGSYFTHFLSSALVGAADEDGDDLVTLAETYRYVYHETVYRTSATRSGTQHPTYEWDLAGKGDVVLADLSASRSTLVFPADMYGAYAIFDQNRRAFVAEVELKGDGLELALRPGTYLIQRRFPSYLEVARVDLADGSAADLSQALFEVLEYEDDLAKGEIDKKIGRARLPGLAVRLLGGQRRFKDEEIDQAYLPAIPLAGAAVRFTWRDGRWVASDLVSGALSTELIIDGLEYPVPVRISGGALGVSAGFATKPRLFQVGGGLRLAATYNRRDFIDVSMAAQDLFSVSPGWVAWGGWHPDRFELELELRGMLLPYKLSEDSVGLGYGEAYLVFGYRF